ncbi:MAG: diphthine--ammonia ligase [archaeon]
MKLAVLFSGGKDSTYALSKAMNFHEIECLITVVSENKESYMFHTPNINLTELQAESMGIPLISAKTKGKKEEELKDLRDAIVQAKALFNIEGIVTGAIESVYQAARIQIICDDLNIWCFNPLWQIDQVKLLHELIENRFEVIISGVFAYPFDESWLGRKIDDKTIKELILLQKKYSINPSGEGGEIETLVLNCPLFKKRLEIVKAQKMYANHSGIIDIMEARLI